MVQSSHPDHETSNPTPGVVGWAAMDLQRLIVKDLIPKAKSNAWVVLGLALAVALGAVLLFVEAFGEIAESVADNEGVAIWDKGILDWAVTNRDTWPTGLISWYSNTGGPIWQPIVTFAVAALLVWRWRDITPLILTAIAAGGSLLMTIVGKNVYHRARPPLELAVPPHESSFSFPSGHTLNATVIVGILAYLLIRHFWDRPLWLRILIAAAAAVYAISMGLTRVFLGHHWFTDVLGGWALGLAWVAVVIALHRVWRAVRRDRERGPIEEEGARSQVEQGS